MCGATHTTTTAADGEHSWRAPHRLLSIDKLHRSGGTVLGHSLIGMAAVAALGVVVGLVAALRNRRRGAALRQWAQQHSWTYADRPATGWENRLPGPRRRARHVVSGVMEQYPVSVADYTYVEGGEYGGPVQLVVVGDGRREVCGLPVPLGGQVSAFAARVCHTNILTDACMPESPVPVVRLRPVGIMLAWCDGPHGCLAPGSGCWPSVY